MTNNDNPIDKNVLFVARHYKQHAFDSRKGWLKMEQYISPRRKMRKLSVYVGAAAAVALLLVASVFYFTINQPKQLFANADNTEFTLPDQTEILMRKGAKLTYDRRFGETDRRVSMRGEITFDVARDERKPFIISTPSAQVKVLGTSFTVSEDEKGTRLDVISGLVEFTPQDPVIPVLCAAGAKVHYIADTKSVEVTLPESSMLINASQNMLTFNNVPLKNIVSVLSHYYNTTIQLPEEESEILFTSSFTGKGVIEILNIINFTLDTHLLIKK